MNVVFLVHSSVDGQSLHDSGFCSVVSIIFFFFACLRQAAPSAADTRPWPFAHQRVYQPYYYRGEYYKDYYVLCFR